MGEQVFKSPGVYSQEIDLSFTGPKEPFGTPAGVVGTAERGPAFVPVTLASFKDFVDTFGKVDADATIDILISGLPGITTIATGDIQRS